MVPVHDLALLVTDDQPVGVPVQGDADVGAVAFDRIGQGRRMGRAAFGVDVGPVRGHADGEDLGAQFEQGGGRDLVAGAVGAIDGDAQTLQRQPLRESLFGDLDIAGLGVVDPLDPTQLV